MKRLKQRGMVKVDLSQFVTVFHSACTKITPAEQPAPKLPHVPPPPLPPPKKPKNTNDTPGLPGTVCSYKLLQVGVEPTTFAFLREDERSYHIGCPSGI